MWHVKCGFDAEDETSNFGTRAVTVGLDGLFETNTIATIESSLEDGSSESELDIKSALNPKIGLMVTIENALIILNKNCTEVKRMVSFEYHIDCFLVSQNGLFIFVGLANASFHCLSIRTGQLVFTRELAESAEEGKSFISIVSHSVNSEEELLIFLFSGAIYRLTGFILPSEVCQESFLNGTISSVPANNEDNDYNSPLTDASQFHTSSAEIGPSFTNSLMEQVCQLDFKPQSVFPIPKTSCCQFLICGSNHYGLFKFGDESVVPLYVQSELDIRKIVIIKRSILALSAMQDLIVICPFTMIPIRIWNERKIKNFSLFGDTNQDIIALSEGDIPSVLMLTIPGLQIKRTIHIQGKGYLIDNAHSLDDFLFLEKCKDLNSIHVKSVVESMPEFRLDRLLKRGKFDQAEAFGQKFGLPVETIYKAKLRKLLQDLQPWTNSEVSLEETFVEALNLLDEIQDVEFIAEFTFNAVLAESSMYHCLLTRTKRRLQENMSKDPGNEEVKKLLARTNAYSTRFDTFLLLDPENHGIEDWLEFSVADLFTQCLGFLEQGELRKSQIIWGRHLHEISAELNFDSVKQLFNEIPSTVSIVEALPWLQQVIPHVLDTFPEVLTEFIEWFLTKVWELEKIAPSKWPSIGVQYAEILLQMIRNPQSLVASEMKAYFWHSSTLNSPVSKLIKIIKTLKEINDLFQHYNIHISTTEYYHDSPEEVVFILLSRAPIDECSRLVNEFLDKYFLENQLIRDKIIARFIEMEIEHHLQWWKCEDNFKEMKIIKLIQCISCPEEKIGSLGCLLKNASIPWSPIVIELANDCLKSYQKKADIIQDCYKMIPLKHVFKKYSIKSILTSPRELRKCVKYIFKEGLDSRLEDALQLVEGQEDSLKMLPYCLYIDSLIQSKKYEEVTEFLFEKQLDETVLDQCCRYIILKFSTHLDSGAHEIIDAVIKILQNSKEKLEKTNAAAGMNGFNNYIEKALVCKSISTMKSAYNFEVELSRLHEDSLRKLVIQDFHKSNLKDLDKTEEFVNVCKGCIPKIVSLLNLPPEDVILYLAEYALCLNDFSSAAMIMSLLRKDVEELSAQSSTVAVKLLSNLMEHQSFHFDSSLTSVNLIVKSLATQSIASCNISMLNKSLEVYNKSVLLVEFCSSSVGVEFPGGGPATLYWDPAVSLASAPFAASFIWNMYSYCHSVRGASIFHETSPHNSLLDKSDTTTSKLEVIPEYVSGFRQIIQRFFGEQQDIKSLKLVCCLMWLCGSASAAASPSKNYLLEHSYIVHSCISALLKKVLGAKHLDLHLAQFLLHYFSTEAALKWLSDFSKNCRNDCHRLGHVSLTGMEYCKKNSLKSEQKSFFTTYLQCNWSKRLLQFNLPTKDTFKQTEKEQKQLLAKLITLPDISVQILTEYCEDFGFDAQEYLLLHLKHLMLSWKPEFELEIDLVGGKKIVVKNSTEHIRTRCGDILTFLENSEELKSFLSLNLWNEVNHYYYELYQVIVDLLELLTHDIEYYRKFKIILFFLMKYQRLCEPTSVEEEFWQTKFSTSQKLPAIAAYRLPVQFLAKSWFNTHADMWSVVKHEFNIQSYKQWFDVLNILGIDKNSICTLAISQTTIADTSSTESDWCVHKKNVQFLKDVKECVEHVTNLEMASASLYHVVNHLPPGADQLTAAELCLMQTKQFFAKEPSSCAETCLNKIQKKYLTISTTHVLYTHKLAKPDYLNLVLDPHELIKELYHDSSIIERTINHTLNEIDINNAALLIAKLHSVNLTNIRLQLLSTWLQPNNMMQDRSLDETMVFSPRHVSASSMEENLIRSCYILESDIENSIRYLVGLIFAYDLDDITPISVQFRALKCLCAIIPSREKLEEVTARDIQSIQSHLQSLMYLNELEKSGLVYSIEGFQCCNKEELIKLLISFRSQQSLKIAVKLCQDFHIVKPNIWKDVVSDLTKYSMIDDLKIVLPHLNGICELANSTEIVQAWNVLLLHLLEKIEPDDKSFLEEFKFFLHSCCVTPFLNLQAIKYHCGRINEIHILSTVLTLTSEFEGKNETSIL
ncbi:unnamed protein product [Bemisia tabaci]|uniref:RZZ complex subunit KNTC1/ROD C-terminal domain-containing protein n=1 Tax=Bemisia tabaci TaxID=7038 RepID=A0A9P0A399_BEMTA|nr:unnamed protein product [Bemisia tabaci]